jgi:hypothetical protein
MKVSNNLFPVSHRDLTIAAPYMARKPEDEMTMLHNLTGYTDQVQHSPNIRLMLSAVARPVEKGKQPQRVLPLLADRRKSPRFKVGNKLICVSDNYAGQILDISPTGLAFQLVKFLSQKATSSAPMHQPSTSERLNILHAGPLSFSIMKNLRISKLHDRATGLLYPGNADIVNYRRGVGFAVPITDNEFETLRPYLAVASED